MSIAVYSKHRQRNGLTPDVECTFCGAKGRGEVMSRRYHGSDGDLRRRNRLVLPKGWEEGVFLTHLHERRGDPRTPNMSPEESHKVHHSQEFMDFAKRTLRATRTGNFIGTSTPVGELSGGLLCNDCNPFWREEWKKVSLEDKVKIYEAILREFEHAAEMLDRAGDEDVVSHDSHWSREYHHIRRLVRMMGRMVTTPLHERQKAKPIVFLPYAGEMRWLGTGDLGYNPWNSSAFHAPVAESSPKCHNHDLMVSTCRHPSYAEGVAEATLEVMKERGVTVDPEYVKQRPINPNHASIDGVSTGRLASDRPNISNPPREDSDPSPFSNPLGRQRKLLKRNNEGLTWSEWSWAAGVSPHSRPGGLYKRAWEKGEDPVEWRTSRERDNLRRRKGKKS